MTGHNLFGKLLKRRIVNSNSPERTPRKRQSRTPTFDADVLPGQIAEPGVAEEEAPKRQQSQALLVEDECTHLRWDKVLAGRSASTLSPDELRALEDTSMPLKHRHALWPQWFIAPDIGDLGEADSSVAPDVADAIDRDLGRTRPQSFGPQERASLRRVLRAYAAANPSVGYCQGMNNIAATFIALGFDDATALSGCYTMLQGCCPGYHDSSLAGFRLDAQVLAALVKKVLSKETQQRLEMLDVPLEALASEHFLTLASKSWPLATTARLWDVILREGSPAVFASFLAMLNLFLPDEKAMACERKLSPVGEEPEPVDIFRSRVRRCSAQDSDALLREVRRLLPLVPQKTINQLRFNLVGKKC